MKVEVEKTQKIYTEEDVVKASTEYFNGDVMAAQVWMKKYALKDASGNIYELTPDDMHRRLAKEFARIEKNYKNPMSEDEIYDLIKKFTYVVPAGSPMAGIGNNFQYMSLSNCFVVGNEPDADSYGGILKLDEEIVQLQKRRAGVGLDLSFIRPIGSAVLNAALTSTGLAPFMERYSNTTREVAQENRRGALIETISVIHPDSEKFIDAKLQEGKVTGANISVKLTDEFMDAALNKKKFVQKYPINSDNPTYKKEIDANSFWKKIIHNSWASAEPGILFWDTIIKESVADCYKDLGFETVSTNPCLTQDAWITTNDGAYQIKDLIGVPFNAIINGAPHKSTNEGFYCTGKKKVYEIITNEGFRLKATSNHLIKLAVLSRYNKRTDWVAVSDLKIGNLLCLNNNKNFSWEGDGNKEIGWVLGSLLGDGNVSNGTSMLNYWGNNKLELKEHAINIVKNNIKHRADFGSGKETTVDILEKDRTCVKSVHLTKEAEKYGITGNKILNEKIEKTSSDFYRGFISGWFDADGTVIGNQKKGISVRLSSSILSNLYIAQRMLARIGIISTVYENRRNEGFRLMPDGKGGEKEYLCKSLHELVISNENITLFNDNVGFFDSNKNEKLKKLINSYTRKPYKEKFVAKVKEIKELGEELVYDCTIPTIGEFDANGIIVHNCAELPLCVGDSCRLMAINLYSYVEEPFTKNAKFNFPLFIEHAAKAQRMMDDMIDLEKEKVDDILQKIAKDPELDNIKRVERELWERISVKVGVGRRTGLGITAEGDMLAALGLTYGTDKAIEFAEKVQKTLKLEAYRSSVNLAKERGAFEIWDAKKEEKNPFIQRIKEEDAELYKDMIKCGRRNIALLTIAPTGSVSLMTQTTSGIEPVFLPTYTRRRKINPQEKDVKVDFVDKQGDSWQEYAVFHHKFETWLQINKYNVEEVKKMSFDDIKKIVEKSPYHKATSADVDWIKNVEMQGRLQKHVDHSISKTINLPSDVTEELIAKVYESGWRCGCKGLTVYRDGCRSGVLISTKEDKPKKVFENHARKRPKVIGADVWAFQNNYEKWVAIVGKLAPEDAEQTPENELPYEIFTGKLDSFPIPSYVKKGQVIKRKEKDKEGKDVSVYDFKYFDEDGYPVQMAGLSRSFDEQYWNYAKLISAVLRHGMPMPYVVNLVEGLKLKGDTLNTWKNGVVRTFKRYVKDGTISADVCDVCGAKLIYVEGCLKCNGCGQSKCG